MSQVEKGNCFFDNLLLGEKEGRKRPCKNEELGSTGIS